MQQSSIRSSQRRAGEDGVRLNETSGPGHDCQRDLILLQLEHGDERRVVHSHRCGSIHCHYLITTPGQRQRPLPWRHDHRPQEPVTTRAGQPGLNLLEAPVEVSRRARHNGFDEERLLAVALLVAPDDTEAPALVVGLLQDDVPAPVHVADTVGSQLRHSKTNRIHLFRCAEGGSTWVIPASGSTAASR